MWLFCFSWCADTAESLCPPVPPSPQLNISAHWASGIVKAGVMKLYFSPNASLTSIAVTEGNGPSYVCSLSLSRFLVLVCRAHTAPPSPPPSPPWCRRVSCDVSYPDTITSNNGLDCADFNPEANACQVRVAFEALSIIVGSSAAPTQDSRGGSGVPRESCSAPRRQLEA